MVEGGFINTEILEKNSPIELENDNFICDYNVFELYVYGISKAIINTLIEFKISPKQIYYNGIDSLNELSISLNKKIKIVDAVKLMFDNQDKQRTIYELIFQGITLGICERLIKNNFTIKQLFFSKYTELNSNYEIGNVMLQRIKKAIVMNNEIIRECNRNVDTSDNLAKILIVETLEKEISFYDLKQLAKRCDSYDFNNFYKDYENLRACNKIQFSSFGLKYAFKSFEEYIRDNYDDKKADILIKRYSGMTLESIAKQYYLTRERVRQICSKFDISYVNEFFVEDKYKSIFQKYDWNKKTFCILLNETELTYSYLKAKYHKGLEHLDSILNDDYFSEEQKDIYKKIYKIVITSDGTKINNSLEFLRQVLIKYASDEIGIEELTERYNEEVEMYPELNVYKLNPRNLERRISDCDFAFFGGNHKVRYYDFNNINDELVNQLKEIINLNDGFYSTDYLFRNNTKLMSDLDIRTSNELHNILKLKIDDDENNVYFIRMPNFLVGYKDKDEFILDKLKEYSPIEINEFINILYEDYGHKKMTILSYLTSNFNTYLYNNIFRIESKKLDENQVEKLKTQLTKPIYSIEYLKIILEKNGYNNISEIITNYNLSFINYKLKSGFIMSNKFTGLYQYFDFASENEEIIKLDEDLMKCGAIYNAVNYVCKEHKLFKINNTIYVTKKKFISLGITQQDILDFVENIKNNYFDKDYFSVYNVMNDINVDIFTSRGLTETFIENLTNSIIEISTLRIDNNKLFTYKKGNISIKRFMEDMAYKYNKMSLYELESKIEENYQINISEEKLRGYLYGTEIFYSNIMNKIYIDKKDYYEEVYNEQ